MMDPYLYPQVNYWRVIIWIAGCAWAAIILVGALSERELSDRDRKDLNAVISVVQSPYWDGGAE